MAYLPDGKSPAAECVTAIDRLAASVMVLIVSSTQLGFPPMNTFDPAQIRTIGIIGSGTIGASWAAYFLARGYQVHAWDPASGWQDRLQQFIDTAWPQLAKLGLVVDGATAHVSFAETPEAVVKAAPIIQESALENTAVKRQLYGRLDAVMSAESVILSSTSGLLMSELQAGLRHAAQFVVGHPFNPPHLIPLVEVVGGKDTDPGLIDWALDFYRHIGKHPIRINKEVPGHLANRLQAALWREALLALKEDLASVADIDAAIAQGPGMRLAIFGPHMIFALAGGKGRIEGFIDHLGPGIRKRWQTMDETNPELTPELVSKLTAGIADEANGRSIDELEAERDSRLLALLNMRRGN